MAPPSLQAAASLLTTTLFLASLLLTSPRCNASRELNPPSPSQNGALTLSERIRAAVGQASPGASYVQSLIQMSSSFTEGKYRVRLDDGDDDDKSRSLELISDGYEYLLVISIGTPPVEMKAILDTGSDLVWAKCRSCRGCPGEGSGIFFDPGESSTYRHLRCASPVCSPLRARGCRPEDLCRYNYSYADASFANGVISRDTLTFHSGAAGLPKVAFGCADDVGGNLGSPFVGGVAGLNRGPLSLISQLGAAADWTFSYCMVPIFMSNGSSPPPPSTLRFGEAAAVAAGDEGVVTTPIAPDSGYNYIVSLLDISVNETLTWSGQTELLIDSGAFLTTLPAGLYRQLKQGMLRHVRLPRARDPSGQLDLCYRVSESSDVSAIPDVVLGFQGGKVALRPWNTFVPLEEGLLCLAVVPSRGGDEMPTLGNLAQQNFHVGFDLVKNTVSLSPKECVAF